jgi:regulator of protease activity HflC (stomatin/prohibitin superfamily)
MSASCIVNRGEVIDIVEDIRASLPSEIQQADKLLDERELVLAEAEAEADRIIDSARAQAAELITQEWVYAAAVREADIVRRDSEYEADRMRQEVDDYVDAKLAGFEVALNKTLSAVSRGREKLRGTDMSPQVFDETGPVDRISDR